MFNELWIEVKGYDYMVDVSPNRDMSLCQLLLYKNPQAFNVFGSPLLRGYYTTHDSTNAKITFTPTPNSGKSKLPIGMLPTQNFNAPLSYSMSIWIYMLTAILNVVLACIYYFILIPYLSHYIANTMTIVAVATGIVGCIVAFWVWVVLPVLQKKLGQQTDISAINITIPKVAASAQGIWPIVLMVGFATLVLKLSLRPRKQSRQSSEVKYDSIASNGMH
jgi:hypothetical protein